MDYQQALEIVRRYVIVLKTAGYQVLEAWLFGSARNGTATEDSDIDVALVIDGIGNTAETQVRLMYLRRQIDLRIEPHPFRNDTSADRSALLANAREHGIRVA